MTLPLIDGREPFILECNGRFCVMFDTGHGPRLFLNADGEWHRPSNGEDTIHRLKSREEAEAFVRECAAKGVGSGLVEMTEAECIEKDVMAMEHKFSKRRKR